MSPIVMRSQQLSVSKSLAVTTSSLSARTVQASLLPWSPAPSVTHSPSLPVSSQKFAPEVTLHHAVFGEGDGGGGDGGGGSDGGDGIDGGDGDDGDRCTASICTHSEPLIDGSVVVPDAISFIQQSMVPDPQDTLPIAVKLIPGSVDE